MRHTARRVDMADDDGLPRLPCVSQPMELPFEPQKVAAAEVVLNSEWSEFPEPTLLGTSWSRRGVTFARLLVFIWAVDLVATAMATRANLPRTLTSTATAMVPSIRARSDRIRH